MSTNTISPLRLSPDDCSWLERLNDSELAALLSKETQQRQSQILTELLNHRPLNPNIAAMPIHPTARQNDFLKLACYEAMYGGAAGGGKSEALLMWLAEAVHVPGYSAIIFRRTFKQLEKSNESLLGKTMRLYPCLGGVLNLSKMHWKFPSGAMIEMGALEHETSVLNYQGPSYHRVAFDELTQFSESQYEYIVNSRVRRTVGFPVTLGVRSASNPGGPGHVWVKNRFVSDDAIACMNAMNSRDPSPADAIFAADKGRMFVPARIADNPFLDYDEYVDNLSGFTDPVMRERLMNGDWAILPNGLIKAEWLRYFEMRGQHLQLLDREGKVVAHCDERECRRFVTIDPAGTSAERSKEAKGKAHSWTVAQCWDMLPAKFGQTLILRDQWRARVDFPGLLAGITKFYKQWLPSEVLIENEKLGIAAVPMLQGTMPISCCNTGGKDKVTRAAPLLNMLEKGQVYLPRYGSDWRTGLEAEWLSWQGLEEQVADQIDPAAYAAIKATSGNASVIAVDFPFWQSA